MKRATVNILLFIIFPGLHLEISPGCRPSRRNLKLDTSHMPVSGVCVAGYLLFFRVDIWILSQHRAPNPWRPLGRRLTVKPGHRL